MYDTAVVIGRFQIPHKAHIDLLKEAKTIAENVFVLIGSVDIPRNIKNPFTFSERVKMLSGALGNTQGYTFVGVRDSPYDDVSWVSRVIEVVPSAGRICLIGHKKDESSFYLGMFPYWDFIPFENNTGLNSTDMRKRYFSKLSLITPGLPSFVAEFLMLFRRTKEWITLQEEYTFILAYKDSWKAAPLSSDLHYSRCRSCCKRAHSSNTAWKA